VPAAFPGVYRTFPNFRCPFSAKIV
jgi:hypothetical protein